MKHKQQHKHNESHKGKVIPVPKSANYQPIWNTKPWKWFFSLHIGVALLTVIGVASIVGTLIPETDSQTALQRSQDLVYYSWWYQCLLVLLAVSLGCSTVKNILVKILPAYDVHFHRSARFFHMSSPSDSFPYNGDAQTVCAALREQGFRAVADENCGYAWKWKFSLWGAPVAHLGMIIVLVAGFFSSWLSQEGFINLLEGRQTRTMVQQSEFGLHEVALGFTLRCDDFETGFFPRTRIPSKFISTVSILDSSEPVYSGKVDVNNAVFAGGWKFHQTSYQEIPGARRFLLEIKNPDLDQNLQLELSPGQTRLLPHSKSLEIKLSNAYPYAWNIVDANKSQAQGKLYQGQKTLRLQVERYVPDFSMGVNGKIASRSDQPNNPALHIAIYDGDIQTHHQWLFAREDLKGMSHNHFESYSFDFVKVSGSDNDTRFQLTATHNASQTSQAYTLALGQQVTLIDPTVEVLMTDSEPTEDPQQPWQVQRLSNIPAYQTTLSLTRNPTIPVIYFACFLMVLGVLISFMLRRAEVWFSIHPDQKKSLLVHGRYRYELETLDRSTLSAIEKLDSQTKRNASEVDVA